MFWNAFKQTFFLRIQKQIYKTRNKNKLALTLLWPLIVPLSVDRTYYRAFSGQERRSVRKGKWPGYTFHPKESEGKTIRRESWRRLLEICICDEQLLIVRCLLTFTPSTACGWSRISFSAAINVYLCIYVFAYLLWAGVRCLLTITPRTAAAEVEYCFLGNNRFPSRPAAIEYYMKEK